jgi:hypothetical protein|tara:strand:+ start:3155 stop:3514 length:360 start_codon:yes stop_codon:yes gene_type:complete
MAKFASGRKSYAISDRSGFRYPYRVMKKEWNGLLVGPDEYESKQPQLGPFRKVVDPQALQNARPDSPNPTTAFLVITTNGIIYLGGGNWATAGTAELPSELEITKALQGAVGTVSVVTP